MSIHSILPPPLTEAVDEVAEAIEATAPRGLARRPVDPRVYFTRYAA